MVADLIGCVMFVRVAFVDLGFVTLVVWLFVPGQQGLVVFSFGYGAGYWCLMVNILLLDMSLWFWF